ncbi:MAG: HD domain-containing protein [Candidatus Diapherotrites archaeon]
MAKENARKIAQFFHEAGQLKRVKRSGWWLAGVQEPESVAEHSFRAAIVGYALAKQEGANAERVMKMLLFHDLPETRIGDMHKVTARYVDVEKAERRVLEEQGETVSAFDAALGKEYLALMREFLAQESKEAVVAKDADFLECALQAREYLDSGAKDAEDWLERIGKRLKTKSAGEIFAHVRKNPSHAWWKNLKKL